MKKLYFGAAALVVLAGAIAITLLSKQMVDTESTTADSDIIVSKDPPIILVHGFNQSSNFWDDVGLVGALADRNTILMGDYFSENDSNNGLVTLRNPIEIIKGQTALYTITFPQNGTSDLRDSAIMLEKAIQQVTARHRCDKVKLITFSAGGVISRQYITDHVSDHKVASLITVSSPHLGSEHAWLAESFRNAKSYTASLKSSDGNFITKPTKRGTAYLMEKTLGQLEDWSHNTGIDINSRAAIMLTNPESGNYLDLLSRADHPADITYHSIITEENILTYGWTELRNDWGKVAGNDFSNTDLMNMFLDLGRNGLGKLDKISDQFTSMKFRGDGVVSKHSQNINNIHAFQNSDALNAGITHLKSEHGSSEMKGAILDALYQ